MEVAMDLWKNTFKTLERSSDIQTKTVQLPSFGAMVNFYSCSAIIPYEGHVIELTQSAHGTNELVNPGWIECTLKTKCLNLELYIVVKSWLDFFMTRPFDTGNRNFDKRFVVKSSNIALAKKMFSDEYVQALFLVGTKMFNISNDQSATLILFKNSEAKLYKSDDLLQFINDFKYLLQYIDMPV